MDIKKKILAIDDDISFLKLVESILSDFYNISVCKSGMQAIKLIEKGYKPDLVLLDIDMPNMDGFVTMSNLQENNSMEDTPIMFVTGLTEYQWELKGLKLGASDFIKKPFNRDVLLARIDVQLKNAQNIRVLKKLKNDIDGAENTNNDVDINNFDEISSKVELTKTEQRVAYLIALGYTNHEICEQLYYSYSYVKKIAHIVFEKIQVKNRNELRKLFINKKGNSKLLSENNKKC